MEPITNFSITFHGSLREAKPIIDVAVILFSGNWRWEVDENDYEVVKQLNKLAVSTPRLLAQDRPCDQESGLRPVPIHEQWLPFLSILKDLVKGIQQKLPVVRISRQHPSPEPLPRPGDESFSEVLGCFSTHLNKVIDSTGRGAVAYDTAAGTLLRAADRLRQACRVYLDCVHPVITHTRREGMLDVERSRMLQAACNSNLSLLDNRLREAYATRLEANQ